MWDTKYLRRIDLRLLFVIIALMIISLTILSATSYYETQQERLLTPMVRGQIQFFLLGWIVFISCAMLDYQKLREWTWILYIGTLILLIGLFFTSPIQNVHRWYRVPILSFAFQPSEYAKLSVVLALSWYLERKAKEIHHFFPTLCASLIAFIPFLLIVKQPDLGTALVLCPITLIMFYFGNVNRFVFYLATSLATVTLFFVVGIFLGLFSHETLRPYATHIIRDYQFERLNPYTHHQIAAQTAIALGRGRGRGFRKSTFTGRQFLPTPSTDSVFPAFTEEFGMIGAYLLLATYIALIYLAFQVVAVAKDSFGRFLAGGIAVYLAVHVVVNIGMMSGCFPITGVPLLLITYGGTSIISTMTALGILQSIYTRRFMF